MSKDYGELGSRWLAMDPDAYDRLTQEEREYLSVIDAPLLAVSRGWVLELGCGTGRFLRQLRALPAVERVVGLDIAPRMLASARGGHHLVQASAMSLPFADACFDAVVCPYYSMRYMDRPRVYAEAMRVLRPGGSLAFTLRSYHTVYLETFWRKFLRRGRWPRSWRTLDGTNSVELNLRSPSAEVAALERAGFRTHELKSVRFLPFLRRWLPAGYWRGAWAAPLGTDVIFLAEKPGASPPPRNAVESTGVSDGA